MDNNLKVIYGVWIFVIVSSMIILPLISASPDLTDDIYLYFAEEETEGAVVEQVTGLDTVTTAARGVEGKIGNGFYYNGTTWTGSTTYKPYTSSINAGSINFWINTTPTPNDYIFYQDGPGVVNNVDTQLGIGTGSYCTDATYFCLSINRAITVETASSNMADGTWHMVTITVDGTTHRMYIDGLNVDNATTGANIFGGQLGNNGFSFGVQVVGTIDERGFWNKSLTNVEVIQLYNNGDGLTYPFAPVDTCTCAGLNNDWEIDMSDNCEITEACNLGTGTLSFTGAGWTKCDAEIKTTNLGDPGATGILYILDDCRIYVS